jgi:hypothetical protein
MSAALLLADIDAPRARSCVDIYRGYGGYISAQ